MVTILALDISSISTGYCIFNNGSLLKRSCGTINPNPRKQYGERLNVFEKELRDIIIKYNPDQVIIEDIFKGRNILTFKSLAMFRGVAINTIYDELSITPISVMASEARKIIGVKNDKEEVYIFIVKKYKLTDYSFDRDNDITDSIALGLCGYIIQRDDINLKDIRKKKRRKRRKTRDK